MLWDPFDAETTAQDSLWAMNRKSLYGAFVLLLYPAC
jgi:hypothetical protein